MRDANVAVRGTEASRPIARRTVNLTAAWSVRRRYGQRLSSQSIMSSFGGVMMKSIKVFGIVMGLATFASPSLADIRVIIIDRNDAPYSLGPANYDNSPTNYANSATNYDNSATNYDNSHTNYDNSKTNFDNGPSGNRSVIGPSGSRVGYYVFSSAGVLNFYSSQRRVAFMPSGGHTQSVFASSGNTWCGTIADISGEPVLALTRNCYLQFLMD